MANVIRPFKGQHDDNNPIDQPSDTYRFMLNGVNESSIGDQGFVSNEGSNAPVTSLPIGYNPLGSIYMKDGETVIFSVNGNLKRSEIGILNKNDIYRTLINTPSLDFKEWKQIEAIYRIRKGEDRYIYWVDGYHKARSINIDRLYVHYAKDFQDYLTAGGDPDTYTGDKWDESSFDLVRAYQFVPRFSSIDIIDSGTIKSGSYNFAIQYIDEDNNPTEWITVSNPVNIFVDSEGLTYETIEGSRNVTNNVQAFPLANKSIRLTLTNFDTNFPFYRVAIIQAFDGTGNISKVLVSKKKSTDSTVFIYSGNDDQLAEIPVEEIQIDLEAILAPEHIEQLQNRLLLGSTKETPYNWCQFQAYASRIKTNLTTEPVILNSIDSSPNQKNSDSTFRLRGFMPGEVYSFGIIYLMKDGSYSPVFHIPGRSKTFTTSEMMYYENPNSNYEDIHNCGGTVNYWGTDHEGNILKNTKQRHHRFPTRKQAGIDLISSTNSIITLTNYRLKYRINLLPGKSFPLDIDGNPISIPIVINYNPVGAGSPEVFTGTLVQSDLGQTIIFYDDNIDIVQSYPPNYFEFDPTSTFWTTYMDVGDEYFNIDYYYEPYTLDTIYNATTSDIFGIEFDQIEKPHRDVVGFYIVRNERLDSDRCVVDNVIFGPNVRFNAYPFSSFTHINTEFTNNAWDTRASWFFSPEHQFLGKSRQFSEIHAQGFYTANKLYTPPIEEPMKDKETGNTLDGAVQYQGVTIRDAMAGTSYNPEFNKKNSKDTDGFALVVGYRARDYVWSLDSSNTIPPITGVSNIYYLNATANKPENDITYYNVSCDNKIGMVKFPVPINAHYWYGNSSPTISKTYGGYRDNLVLTASTNVTKRLVYATLMNNNITSYDDFMTRDYYKEHSNPVLFGDSIEVNNFRVFNGDAQISPINFITSMYRGMAFANRKKKSSVWKIIAGAVLIVVGVIAGIFTAGAGLAVSAAGLAILGAGALAISFGVSLAVSGIKFEQMKNMIENDYDKGLQQHVDDYEVQGQLVPGLGANITSLGDDALEWFSDRANNLWIESTIPMGLRSGITAGVTDFINAPSQYKDEEFRSYLVDKLTILDRDHNEGRIYKGFPSAEFYDINLDYMRFNQEKLYIHLPEEYDCCNLEIDYGGILGPEAIGRSNPLRIWYSQQSFQEELTDNYRVFLPNNYRDIEGEHGKLTNMYKMGDTLYIHTDEALWQLPSNIQERVTDEIISFIGTGNFFSLSPKKVVDDTMGSAGSQHKWATVKTKGGVFSINEREGRPYLHTDSIKDISNGRRNWFKNNMTSYLNTQFHELTGTNYPNSNNPSNINGIGYHAVYDARHERIILTKKDYLMRPETVENFAGSFFGILGAPVDKIYYDQQYHVFAIKTLKPGPGLFYIRNIINLNDPEYFINKSWTASFSFHTGMWVSMHSYLPNYYMSNQHTFYATEFNNAQIYRHNIKGKYQEFFGKRYPWIVEFVSNKEPLQTKIWNDLTFNTVARKYDISTDEFNTERYITFNKIIAYNNRQISGEQNIVVKDENSDIAGYLSQQIENNVDEIIADKNEENWTINDLRDYRIDLDKTLFTNDYDIIGDQFPIDKVINTGIIDFNKAWFELESFRDKYLVIRLKFDNFDDHNLILKYIIDDPQNSDR